MVTLLKVALIIQFYHSNYIYPALAIAAVIAVIALIIVLNYIIRLKRLVDKKQHKHEQNYDISQQFNALINSLNDIIFEFDENKVCLNVWYNDKEQRVVDPKQTIGKKLAEIIGPEKAKKFDDALDYVMSHKKSTSLEYVSDYGTGEWFLARFTPVFDNVGDYTSRISASLTNISAQKKYADALKENELLLLEAQIIAKTGNWWYDYDTKEIFLSENLYSILEISSLPGEINKFDYYMQMVHPDDREKLDHYLHTLPQADDINYEHKFITPNGNLKYLKILKGNALKQGNDSKRIFGIIQDITESRTAEKVIKLSRTELLEAQTIAKIGNWKWDTDTRILIWSDEISSIFEIDQSTLQEFGALKILLTYIDKHDKFILQHFLKKAATVDNYSFVFRIITKTRKVKYLSLIVGKLLHRDDGTARKLIGTLQDITERKQAEIAYKRTESKYKLVLETIKLVALSLDNNGKVTFCNQYLANLLGYTQKEMLGKKWLDFIPEGAKEIIAEWYKNNAIKAQYINPIICRNGEQRIISWQNTITYDENARVVETTSIGEDVTDQQKATQDLILAKELAEKASAFKSEFLSIMSHEIRTPMNAVIGTTNLLLSEDPKPDQLEYLNILKFSGENLLAIINDILDYNKIEAGKVELNNVQFNLYHLAQKIKKTFHSKAVEKSLEIELIINKSVPEYVLGDQMRLSQILVNLVGNAVNFTHTGKVSIELDLDLLAPESATIKFTITDTGIGIAADNLRIIFDPFTQESQYAGSQSGGTGLGLAITKRLIELHKSNVHVASELGQGTKFTFSIRFGMQQAPTAAQLATKSEVPMLNLYGMNILLVDDNSMNLLIAAKFLKKWQANVDEAYNGQIAVEMVEVKTYDLIIMDLQMPVMDGFEASRIIKNNHPNIPIIALTADAMPETYSKALNSGMVDYLTKPFIPEIFFEKIAKFYEPTT